MRRDSRAGPVDPPVAVAAEVERTIRAVAPTLTRVTKYGAPTYQGRGDVVTIGVWTNFVAVGFWGGQALAPDHALLEGSGAQTRVVRLRSRRGARSAAFRALVRAAVRQDAADPVHPKSDEPRRPPEGVGAGRGI